MRRLRKPILGVLVACLLGAPAGLAESSDLPPIESLRQLRAARIAELEGDPERALRLLHAALEAFPDQIGPLYALISFHRRHPLTSDERLGLDRRLIGQLEDDEAPMSVAMMVQIAGDPEADDDTLGRLADRVARHIEATEVGQPDLLKLLAVLQQRLDRKAEAVETLERLDRLEPSEQRSWARYLLYIELDRWDKAAEILAPLVEQDNWRHLRGLYVRVLSKAGRFDEQKRQIDLFVEETMGIAETVAAESTDSATSEVGTPRPVSSSLEVADPTAPHTAAFQTAAGLDPRIAGRLAVLRMAAWDLRDQGEDERAESLFRRVLDIDAGDAQSQAALLHLYGSDEERQQLAAAEAQRWQAEEDPQTLFHEGTQRLTAGDFEAALELLRRAAPGLPELEAAWYNLGMAAYRAKDWSTVESALARACELEAGRGASFFFRGLALVELDRCGDAVVALTRALELEPQRDLAHYHLARCYRLLGDSAAAARHQKMYDATRG